MNFYVPFHLSICFLPFSQFLVCLFTALFPLLSHSSQSFSPSNLHSSSCKLPVCRLLRATPKTTSGKLRSSSSFFLSLSTSLQRLLWPLVCHSQTPAVNFHLLSHLHPSALLDECVGQRRG